jgi:mono/diheme cytochrome c family protein
MFKRIVNVVEILVLIGTAVAAVLLFTNQPESSSSASPYGPPGAALFAANCAACHGSDGGGGTGVQLSDGKVRAAFPDVADEIKVVTNGRGGMPAFGSSLSAADITLVVDYTRTL